MSAAEMETADKFEVTDTSDCKSVDFDGVADAENVE